ncbi:hypothetical protein APED_12820 [Acanthopleuribacter pedis]
MEQEARLTEKEIQANTAFTKMEMEASVAKSQMEMEARASETRQAAQKTLLRRPFHLFRLLPYGQ